MSEIVFSPQDAIVAIMVAVSASDETIRTSELLAIQRIVDSLPFFGNYQDEEIRAVSEIVWQLFEQEDGLDRLWKLVREALPSKYFETAYAMACDVVAADGSAREGELRMLEEMRYELDIDRLAGAAIERAARVRHMTLY